MSKYYNPSFKKHGLYNPDSPAPFRLSRSKIDLFLNCPRCFYFDRRLGISQPPGYPFSLNSAVDRLLKKEFDFFREKSEPHPLMQENNIDAIPFKHEKMNEWRDALHGGMTFVHEPTNFLVTGGVDDVWVSQNGELIIVDYKATSKSTEVNLDSEWQIGYKRQMEVYQWLFKKNGFNVSKTGYFVYCNGIADKNLFDKKLEFDIKLLPYEGDDSWIEKTLLDAKACLMKNALPAWGEDCDFCKYRRVIREFLSAPIKK